jgi:putative transcriptional regulator
MKTLIAPGFLIASPALLDPNFNRTVVLMCIHSSDNALGLVINRPSGLTVRRVFDDLGLPGHDDMDTRDVLVGGPVQTHQGWVLFADDGPLGEDEIEVGHGLRLSASRTVLERISEQDGPRRYLLLFGYAGWGPQQLEQEIAEGAWLPAEFDESLIFDAPLDQRWDKALASSGIDPAYVSLGGLAGMGPMGGDKGGGMEA